MNVDEMIQRAHQNARDKGFWDGLTHIEDGLFEMAMEPSDADGLRDAIVCQKLALVATEVREFRQAARELSAAEALEELADVVIRVFDLCGYLGDEVLVSNSLFQVYKKTDAKHGDLALELYEEVAGMVEALRSNHLIVFSGHVDDLVHAAHDYAYTYFGVEALERAIERKMSINEARPHKHGKRY